MGSSQKGKKRAFCLFGPEEKSMVESNTKQIFTTGVYSNTWHILEPKMLAVIINIILQNRNIQGDDLKY